MTFGDTVLALVLDDFQKALNGLNRAVRIQLLQQQLAQRTICLVLFAHLQPRQQTRMVLRKQDASKGSLLGTQRGTHRASRNHPLHDSTNDSASIVCCPRIDSCGQLEDCVVLNDERKHLRVFAQRRE